MKIVCIAGPSDAGKTSLVEALVPKLSAHGRVGTVKSIHHEIEVDTPGTDTYRHAQAGAETVIGITPSHTFEVTARGKRDPAPDPAVSGILETRASGDCQRSSSGNGGGSRAGSRDDRRELRALEVALSRLERRGYAFVLVEGFSRAPLPTVLVGDRSPESVPGEVLGTDEDDLELLVDRVVALEELTLTDER